MWKREFLGWAVIFCGEVEILMASSTLSHEKHEVTFAANAVRLGRTASQNHSRE